MLVPGSWPATRSLRAMTRTCARRASAPTAPTSTPTSAARCDAADAARVAARVDRDQARPPGARSSGTASAACSPAGSPYAGPTCLRASSPWAARCSRPGAHHVLADRERRRAGPAQPGRRARADGRGLRGRRRARGRASTRAGSRCPPDVAFTAVYSRRDGIVDWRACVDPQAHAGRGAPPRTSAWPSTRA